MSFRKSCLVPTLVASFALAFGACNEADPESAAVGSEGDELVLASPATSGDFNRKVEEVIVGVDPATGQATAQVRYGLEIFDESSDTLDLSAKIVVSVNGRIKDIIDLPPVVKYGAITCAVTCAGACPSVFGNGVCSACRCNFSNWFSSGFGGSDAPRPGDVVSARIVPTAGALAEAQTGDDVGRFVMP
jgi:hypothetical protein